MGSPTLQTLQDPILLWSLRAVSKTPTFAPLRVFDSVRVACGRCMQPGAYATWVDFEFVRVATEGVFCLTQCASARPSGQPG
jgi:hypothetical protein